MAGLGNPGRKYSGTRHNIGFLVVEELGRRLGGSFLDRNKYRIARGSVEGEVVILLEPLTYMNLSGLAVREALRRHGIGHENLVVVHDDMDLSVGRLKIRKGGSAGGHNGVESVIAETGSGDFVRVKVGVGRDMGGTASEHVLGRFTPEEKAPVMEAAGEAVEAVLAIITNGVQSAMNRFNKRPKPKEEDPPTVS